MMKTRCTASSSHLPVAVSLHLAQVSDVNGIVERLLLFLESGYDHIVAETLIQLKDLLRRYPDLGEVRHRHHSTQHLIKLLIGCSQQTTAFPVMLLTYLLLAGDNQLYCGLLFYLGSQAHVANTLAGQAEAAALG